MFYFYTFLLKFICFISVQTISDGHKAGSPVHIDRLLYAERELVSFCKFLAEEDRKLHNGKDKHGLKDVLMTLEDVKYHNEEALENVHHVQENPLEIYYLKARLTRTWLPLLDSLENCKIMQKFPEMQSVMEDIHGILKSDTDLGPAIWDVIRLAKMFKISVKDVTLGRLGPYRSQPMGMRDVTSFGSFLHENGNNMGAIEWLTAGKDIENCSNENLLESRHLLGSVQIRMGALDEANNTFTQLHESAPSRSTASSLALIQQMLEKREAGDSTFRDEIKKTPKWHSLCHGKYQKSSKEEAKLKCHSKIVMPGDQELQIEVLNEAPRIVRIRNIFKPNIVENILKTSANKMWNGETSVTNIIQTRVYIKDETSFISEAIAYLRNITVPVWGRSKEDVLSSIKIAVSGPGYSLNPTVKQQQKMRNVYDMQKIAKFYIFLNEPKEGGGLAFPDLNLYIEPIENSAVFWQYRSPTSPVLKQFRTFLECPILSGTQWYGKAVVNHYKVVNKVDL